MPGRNISPVEVESSATLRKKNVYTKKILFDSNKPFNGHRTNGIYVWFKEMNALKARKYFFQDKKIFLKS